jgi:phosphoserine aminotransferase
LCLDEALEAKFVAEAKANGMIGVKGHRSFGGIRVSMYNAMTFEGALRITMLMRKFRMENP